MDEKVEALHVAIRNMATIVAKLAADTTGSNKHAYDLMHEAVTIREALNGASATKKETIETIDAYADEDGMLVWADVEKATLGKGVLVEAMAGRLWHALTREGQRANDAEQSLKAIRELIGPEEVMPG